MTFIIIVVVILGLVLWFMLGSRKSAEKVLIRAKHEESEKRHKEACYTYATAVLGGALPREAIIRKIKSLWEQFGPFDYSDIEKRLGTGDTDGCGTAGHFCVMSIIEEAITGQKRKYIISKKDIKLK